MSKQFLAILAAIILIFAGIVIVSGKKDAKNNGGKSSGSQLSQHYTGNLKSNVTLTEYGDFQCPYCEQYEQTVEQVRQAYNDTVRFQFRNFPLTNLHQNAFAAARAAEAAGLQNKYWEMHDALYQPSNWQVWTQSTTPSTQFNQIAQQIGLNVDKFKTDFASDNVNSTINADMAEGGKLGITGTPTFFLDGKQVQIPNDLASFKKVIDAELGKKAPKTTTTTQSQPASEPAPAQ